MKKVKVSASFGGKIPTGSYQNMSPSFFAEEEMELSDSLTDDEVLRVVKLRQQELQGVCYSNFEAEAIKARIMKVQADRKDFRWYKLPSGEEVPSVTSVIGYDTEFFADEEEMKQYAAQGTINHARVNYFIKEGKWLDAKDIPGIGAELFILKTGSLTLSPDACDFPAFLKKYKLTDLKNGHSVINEKERYGGEYDGEGIYEDNKESGALATIFDVKRSVNKVKNFMQTAAYCKAKGLEHIKQMMIIPLSDKNEQGFSKPIISREIDRYYELFLAKRKEFYKVYGV